MILENFYAKIGGNYNEVLERLLSEKTHNKLCNTLFR